MKALEYKIWARSYYKDKGNYINLSKVRDILRKMKTNEKSEYIKTYV